MSIVIVNKGTIELLKTFAAVDKIIIATNGY